MFGHNVHWRSDEPDPLLAPAARRTEYAREILAELLTRAGVLRESWHQVLDMQLRDDPDYSEALEAFHRAAGVFLRDADEAAVRARRAMLVAEFEDGFTCESGELEEQLAKIGGPYPWAVG